MLYLFILLLRNKQEQQCMYNTAVDIGSDSRYLLSIFDPFHPSLEILSEVKHGESNPIATDKTFNSHNISQLALNLRLPCFPDFYSN